MVSILSRSTNTSVTDYNDSGSMASLTNPTASCTSLDLPPSSPAIAADLSLTDKANVKFAVLIGLIEVGQVSNKDVVNNVLQLVSYISIRSYFM